MSKVSLLKRGFKAEAERKALYYRESLSIHPCEPLCAFQLASFLDIPVYPVTEFLKAPDDIGLFNGSNGRDPEWSALTMITSSSRRIIIHNPFNSKMRQQSDLMHELAHIICEHTRTFSGQDFEIPFGMREYDELQEEEANCLGSTMQLPKACLLWAKKRKMSYADISIHFNASIEMVKFRMNITGIFRRQNFNGAS